VIALASLIERFTPAFLAQYPKAVLPSHREALSAMAHCRTRMAARMLAQCSGCQQQLTVPHSCGHRSCPHCQHFESQRWIERQCERLVAGNYFLVTFTLPAELRPLAWAHQRIVYDLLMECAWQTLRTFSHNHRRLQGSPGAISVLHTHARDLHFHPHVHVVIPAAALDADRGLWRMLPATAQYLFDHKALAQVFRGKLLAALHERGLVAPAALPEKWVVDCKCVGDGRKAIVYLGRYLYRGVISEHDIVGCDGERVTYRWRDGRSGKTMTRTVSGATFLWLVLQHVLPKGLRRSRNHGFLHPNSKRLIALLRLLVFRVPAAPPTQRPGLVCRCCGAPMVIVQRRIRPILREPPGLVVDVKI
jgi:hypothetical protein